MGRTLYDLAGKNEVIRFSPFCWRTKMALRHKGLEFETAPWRFTDKDVIAQTGQGRVPVLVDDQRWLNDSWPIALYLDQAYPDRPALMRTPAERAAARFVNHWCDQVLHPTLRPLLWIEIYKLAADKDLGYFRESREKLLGKTLEAYSADRKGALETFWRTMQPMESTLAAHDWLGGDGPNYADYILFGSLQWANVVTPDHILPPDSATARWFDRMLDLNDRYARSAPTRRDASAA